MKIQCDVCEKDEASIFCTADEAALCSACDHRVHYANKLAGKHQRFSLHHPSPKQAPLCDICQDRRAFLFCQQDRAILCRECDIPIHKANEHTQRHTRFLLTGIKLSATSSLQSSSPSSSLDNNGNYNKSSGAVSNILKPEDSKSNTPVCLMAPTCTPCIAKGTTFESTTGVPSDNVQLMNGGNFSGGAISASSISEYLEMLPGWRVEDVLDFSSSYVLTQNIQNMEKEVPPFWDDAEFRSSVRFFPAEKMEYSVPQVEPRLQQTYQSMEMAFGFADRFIEQSKEFSIYNNNNNIKSTRKTSEDNSFAVPQFIPHSIVSKRSKTFY